MGLKEMILDQGFWLFNAVCGIVPQYLREGDQLGTSASFAFAASASRCSFSWSHGSASRGEANRGSDGLELSLFPIYQNK